MSFECTFATELPRNWNPLDPLDKAISANGYLDSRRIMTNVVQVTMAELVGHFPSSRGGDTERIESKWVSSNLGGLPICALTGRPI